MNYFIDKKYIAQQFFKSANTYEEEALIQEELARKLIDTIVNLGITEFNTCLEIGCCVGNLTSHLLSKISLEKLYVNDLVEQFERVVTKRFEDNLVDLMPLFGDVESLTLPSNLDLVVSGSTFQWLANLDTFLANLACKMNEDGLLVFSIFTDGTYRQIKELTGYGLAYKDVDEIRTLVEGEFEIIEIEQSKENLLFDNSMQLLKHMKKTGVTGVVDYRWTKGKLVEFEKNYFKLFGIDDKLPLSYNNATFICRRN